MCAKIEGLEDRGGGGGGWLSSSTLALNRPTQTIIQKKIATRSYANIVLVSWTFQNPCLKSKCGSQGQSGFHLSIGSNSYLV